jgi:hypothetical protein
MTGNGSLGAGWGIRCFGRFGCVDASRDPVRIVRPIEKATGYNQRNTNPRVFLGGSET